MEKRMITLIMLIVIMFSLFGCDIQDKNRSFDKLKTETDESKEKNKIITALNNKHNQYNAYRICEENENTIQQLNLEGKLIHTFEIAKGQKGITLLKIAYVTNEEIIYILDKDDKFELWTIPLIQNNNKDEVQTEKKKLIFRTIDTIDVLYADTNYIAYIENWNYEEFDHLKLLRTDTLNTDTEEDSVVIYKNDRNGNQLATVNRYDIPSGKKDSTYVDIDVTLGDNRLNENVVNHYNALNQLTQTLTKNHKVSFAYDAEGLRTSKTVNGEKMVFVWDGDQLVMELSESGKVQKRYVRGNDLVYADKGDNTEKQYYATDSHGNVVQLTDENGKVIKTYEYDSFGNEVKPDGKDDNPFRYCGEYYDKETGEIYLRARYYQPAVGRFLTRDTYTGEEDEPESLHLYAYCGNDGVNMVDPSGHCSKIKYVNFNIKTMNIMEFLFHNNLRYWDYKCNKHKKKNPKKISSEGIEFIKKAEGFVGHVYDAGDGKRTIGYGHVLKKGERIKALKENEATNLLKKDLKKNGKYNKKLCKCLNNTVKIHVRQFEYDALLSLTFNVGENMWEKSYSPGFIKLLKSGKLDSRKVINQFLSYDHMKDKTGKLVENKGLWRRHLNEGLLFTKGKYKYYGIHKLKKKGWKFKAR